jgi:hypothetical protein
VDNAFFNCNYFISISNTYESKMLVSLQLLQFDEHYIPLL